MDAHRLNESMVEVATAKAWDAKRHYASGISIACDTVVTLNNLIFGKPINRTHAREILYELSGQTHLVRSALVLTNLQSEQRVFGVEESAVTFRTLHPDEIERYLDSPEPYDKAGAYAIQGAASVFVERISGCLTNIIGFPVSLFLELKQAIERTHSS